MTLRKKDHIFWEECYKIIGACLEVHKELGCGFLEGVYQEALEIEFRRRNIPFEREKELSIIYKGEELKKKFYADFVCYDKIIIETKACSKLIEEHISQVLNYLNATNHQLGLLFNNVWFYNS
ncbi:MAG: GxxExxY protein [Candidatus Aminicenantes bacterium]|nr:MAG: GxxExxY protein [Candidatus Aminicenantes bacterium]